ncbi:MAG: hydroxysqualene dehydroxylase HpnE [Phycisphaerales bacterium]|nr:FAD-dependent oxidoreductase [Planctomycetota bacterium]MCH8507311.1 hydroxysqualene dehydroxylase HpnE [Phycisphaerales bacterium]
MTTDPEWDAAVVGGGLAGIAAALTLADHGRRVVLLEQTRRLGGRASSFVDPTTGEELDNCQHVVMGCCTNYRALIDRLGMADAFAWSRDQWWVSAGGRTDRIAPGLLPAPAHHAGSFLRASFLTAGDKLGIARAMARLARVDPGAWRDRSFAEFLADTGQTRRAVARFWRPVVVSACNAEPEHAGADLAMKVFREGLMAGAEAGSIGVPRVPLARLYEGVPGLLERHGSSVRFGAFATRIHPGPPATIELRDAEPVRAERVILALPFERVASVLDPSFHDPRVEALSGLAHSPILGVHLRLDRPVLPTPHAVLVDRPTQWLFRKDDDGRAVHAVVSAADDWTALPDEAITARVVEDLRACYPDAGPFTVEWSRPVRSKRATFLARPGVHAHRPPVAASDSPLLLAGDYTDTGWPATMEGAVRSGIAAAAAVLGRDPATMLTPDLPFAPLASAVMRRRA